MFTKLPYIVLILISLNACNTQPSLGQPMLGDINSGRQFEAAGRLDEAYVIYGDLASRPHKDSRQAQKLLENIKLKMSSPQIKMGDFRLRILEQKKLR